MQCQQTITLEVVAGCVPDTGPPVPSEIGTPISPVAASSVLVDISNDVMSPVSFAAVTSPGAYRIEYSLGFFERVRGIASQPPTSDRFTGYSGFPAVISDWGDLAGIREPCDTANVSTGTLALNPVLSGLGLASGTVVNLWSDDGFVSCTSDVVPPTTGSIVYNLIKYKSVPGQIRVVPSTLAGVLAAFDTCAACPDVTVEPVWDGTFPILSFPNITTADWFSNGFFNLNGKQVLFQVSFFPSAFWDLQITCDFGAIIVWRGRKTVGDSPAGTYMRYSPFPGYLCSDGPDCIHIEAY